VIPQEPVKVLSQVCFPIVLPAILLELLDDAPLVAELLLPPSEVLLVPCDVVEAIRELRPPAWSTASR
jgi:hypothetical protein